MVVFSVILLSDVLTQYSFAVAGHRLKLSTSFGSTLDRRFAGNTSPVVCRCFPVSLLRSRGSLALSVGRSGRACRP